MKRGVPAVVIADLNKGKPVSRRRAENAIRFCATLVEIWMRTGVDPKLINLYAREAKFIAEKCCVR